jgi:hypothetical protein
VRQSPEHLFKLGATLLGAAATASPLLDSLGPLAGCVL